jgi:hypothetical protein
MHVGVEEVMPEDLCEKQHHAVFRKALDIRPRRTQGVHVTDLCAENALLDENLRAAVVPVDVRHVKHVRALEVSFELGRVGGLTHQVEFIEDRVLVFVDDFQWPQALAVFPVAVGEAGQHAQYFEVALDLFKHTRAQDLDDDFGARLQLRRVNLRYRCGGERLGIEALEDTFDRFAVGFIDDRNGLFRREGRDRVLELGEFVRDVGWQQVTSCRYRLAELDEDRTKFLERQANALAHRSRPVAPPWCEVKKEAQRPQQVRFLDDVVQPVLNQHALNREHSKHCAPTSHVRYRP